MPSLRCVHIGKLSRCAYGLHNKSYLLFAHECKPGTALTCWSSVQATTLQAHLRERLAGDGEHHFLVQPVVSCAVQRRLYLQRRQLQTCLLSAQIQPL